MDISSSKHPIDTQRQSQAVPTECKVCGAPAIYSYFGAIACQSCKIFFRRNARQGLEVLKCKFNTPCEIDVNSRHVCASCRLAKCFACGMQREMIRSPMVKSSVRSQARKRIEESTRTIPATSAEVNELKQFPTLNLLQTDQPPLTVEQWNLISSLSRSYDQYSGLLAGERYMREQNLLPYRLRFKNASIIEMIKVMLDGIPFLYNTNQDFLSLPADDRSILLHTTIAHIAGLSSTFILSKIGLMEQHTYDDAVAMLGHSDLVSTSKRIHNRLHFDTVTMKLFLDILIFSTATYTVYSNTHPVNLSNNKQILDIQNKYIDLTWRYLLNTHNFERSVVIFSDLIRCIFSIYDSIVQVHDVHGCMNQIDALVQQTSLSISRSD